MLGSGSIPSVRSPCPGLESQQLTIKRFLTTRPDKFKTSFQMTTMEYKTNKQKFLSKTPLLLKQFDVFLKTDYMHEPYYRKGLYRATQKVSLSSMFGLRTGEKY